MPRTPEDKEFVLSRVIPHKLHALYALTVAVDIRKKRRPEDTGSFSLVIGDKVRANGNAARVVDPWLEVGIVYGRRF